MKTFEVTLMRQMEIKVIVQASDEDSADSKALGLAEDVGYTNLSPNVTVCLDVEALIENTTEI